MRKSIINQIVISITLLLLSAELVYAAPVPDTGQTKCYNNSAEIPCPQPGEPFYGQDAQYGDNLHSYTDLGNGIVRDNVSGLEWQQATAADTYGWQESIDYCNNLNLGGHEDWRLPNAIELATLVDSNRDSPPTINQIYFPDTQTVAGYWSSTPYAFEVRSAWYVRFIYDGSVYQSSKVNSLRVRAVRSGQTAINNFVDNGDGTVTDHSTGLMWQQTESPSTYTWEQALAHCEGLELAGYSDWRLPNRNELQSIVDYSTFGPSIDTTYFPETATPYHWSSTTYARNPSSVVCIAFADGNSKYRFKSENRYVRAVRLAQCEPPGDSDQDGICDDGDNSGMAGDSPCMGGNIVLCDDNCPVISNPDQADTDEDGIGDACDDETPPDIMSITTNQGPDQSAIPLDNGTFFCDGSQNVIWTCQDPAYPGDDLGWSSRVGVEHTYFSYKLTTDTIWQLEQETVIFNNPGFYGQWSWVNPIPVIGADGDYDIRLAAEDAAGNRSEVTCQITIDTTTDTDADDVPDCVDNCPGLYNPDQLDTDSDNIGDVCDACPNDASNDADADGICGDVDNCPNDPDNDADGDGICGDEDECPGDPLNDPDHDNLCGLVDNCPERYNPNQSDSDSDGIGDACDDDFLSIWNGDYTIRTTADIANLSAYTRVTGSLRIISSNLSSLAGLESLNSVDGELLIAGNTVLTNLAGLNSLTSVGGELIIESNSGLLSLNGLENLTSVGGGGLRIQANDGLTSLSGLENLTSAAGYLKIYQNDALTSLAGLNNLTSVGGDLRIDWNFALANLMGLNNLTSVGGDLIIGDVVHEYDRYGDIILYWCDQNGNDSLINLNGLESLTSVGGRLRISCNHNITNLSGAYNISNLGGNLEISHGYGEPGSLCDETATDLESRLRGRGFTGESLLIGNEGTACPPELFDVTTNQGPEDTSVLLNNSRCLSSDSHNVLWIAKDPDFPGDDLGWASRQGVSHTYFSYKLTTDMVWSAEVETVQFSSPGFSGVWNWVNPLPIIGTDGDYDIRLAAEDAIGNRNEVFYQINIDTTGTDTDEDGVSDCADNCPDTCNPLQLDADLDGLGDLCDIDPGCELGGCVPCEETCQPQ